MAHVDTSKSGDLLLVTDTTGRGHSTVAVGDPPLRGCSCRRHDRVAVLMT
jgi:hypothetical protein